tara:strand:+ start:10919 stop:13354 length:2436 start_codon:yes stop_codon:yes gene_type:complete
MANKEQKKTSGKLRFKEQCYLLWNISSFTSLNSNNSYENMAVIQGEPTEVINKLVSKPGLDRLFELKPYENSSLVPLIRLYKTEFGDSESTKEIKFSTVLSKKAIDSITSNRAGRGDGIGIKNVSYDLQGGSTTGGAALVKKGVTQVNITFVFQNLEMLVQKEGNGQPALIDLVTFPPASTKTAPPNCAEGSPIDFTNVFDAGKFAIKLVYGYATPDSDVIDQELRELIDRSRTTLLLNLQRHEFDFRQDGTIELSCQYMGYTDAIMSRPESDLFFVGEERDLYINEKTKEIDSITEQLNKAKEEKKNASGIPEEDIEELDDAISDFKEELEEQKKEQKEEGENDRVNAYQRLLSEIYNSGKVLYVELDADQVEQHLEEVSREDTITDVLSSEPSKESESDEAKVSKGALIPEPQKADVSDLSEGIEDVAEAESLEDFQEELGDVSKANTSTKPKDAGDIRINYIYYGDLLNIAFGVLKKNPQASPIKPMIGPIAYNDPKSGQSIITNLADIPISLNKFIEWFNKNVVAQNRQEYLLEDFVRDTIKGLIHAALGENCFSTAGYPAPEPSVTVSSLPVPKKSGASIIPLGARTNIANVSAPGSTHYQDASKIDQYNYIYAYTFGLSNLNGDRNTDHDRGIYHLQIGADRGLVKKITFSRIDDPKLAASRATSVKCDLRHLRENYKVNVTMIGNSLFRPGQTIYINPTLAGGSDPGLTATVADALGLGGYYTVTKVSGDLGRDGFSTEIEAYWQSSRVSRPAGIQVITPESPAKGGFTGAGATGGGDPAEEEIDASFSGGGGTFGGGGNSKTF